MPHGHCYLWKPSLIWTHLISDVIIGSTYVLIAFALWYLVRKVQIPFSPIVLSFGVFIGACGGTHWMEVWNLWRADYWWSGLVKGITAVASVTSGVLLYRVWPQIRTVADAAKLANERRLDLEALTSTLEGHVQERTEALEKALANLERGVRERTRELTAANSGLRQRETVLSQAERLAKMGSFEWRPTEDSVQLSSGFRAIADFSPDIAAGTLEDISNRLHPVDRNLFRDTVDRVWDTGEAQQMEVRMQLPSWGIRTLQMRCAQERDERGNAIGVIGVTQDITEVIETQKELRELKGGSGRGVNGKDPVQ